MHRRLIGGLLGGLLLAGCGSGTSGGKTDAYIGDRPDTSVTTPVDTAPTLYDTAPAGPDAGCDEDAMTVNGCIINPPGTPGGGTVVARQNPASWQTCKP